MPGEDNKKYVFEHFQPLGDHSVRGIVPNFTGNVDVFHPKKSQAHFEELAVQTGLGKIKSLIFQNTLNFFSQSEKAKALPQFPAAVQNTMTVLGHNMLGFPVYSNLVIKGDTYQDNNGNTIGSFNDIRLDAVIMELSQENNLITTDIQGRNGTIIEYISNKSWTVTVTGRILAKHPGIYPQEDVQQLMIALQSNKALRVTSWWLNMAGIYNIVIKRKNVNQEEGSQEYQKFDFEAIADQPVILKLSK